MITPIRIEAEHISDPASGVTVIRDWLSYEVESDMFKASDAFTMRVAPTKELREFFRLPGHIVRIFYGGHIQMTGVVDATPITGGADGPQLEITGRDFGGLLDSDCAMMDFSKNTLMDIMTAQIAPWREWIPGIELDYTLHRWRICGKKAKKKSMGVYAPITGERLFKTRSIIGDTVNALLSRLAPQIGCHSWFSADGHLIIARPNYTQEPLHKLYYHLDDHGNVLRSNCHLGRTPDIGDRYSDYNIVGQGYVNATQSGKAISDHASATRDPSKSFWYGPLNRRLLKSSTRAVRNVQDKKLLLRHARTQMERKAIDTYGMVGEAPGHEMYEGGPLWSIDTMVDVDYQPKQIDAPHMVSRRKFIYDSQGPRTTFNLIPPIWLSVDHDKTPDSKYNDTMTKLFDRYAL